MDYDSFLSLPRWAILEIIAKNPSSPIEIAEKLNTSVSYISQQLKLLEAANIVTKKKTGSVEKGKPRNLYSISKEILHITALVNHHPAKKLIHLNDHHKTIINIWTLPNQTLHYHIEKLYWKIEDSLDSIEGIFAKSHDDKIKIYVISDSKKLQPKLDHIAKESHGKITASIITKESFERLDVENLHPIYDPESLTSGNRLKGGSKSNEG